MPTSETVCHGRVVQRPDTCRGVWWTRAVATTYPSMSSWGLRADGVSGQDDTGCTGAGGTGQGAFYAGVAHSCNDGYTCGAGGGYQEYVGNSGAKSGANPYGVEIYVGLQSASSATT